MKSLAPLVIIGIFVVAFPAQARAQEAPDTTSRVTEAVGTGLEVKGAALDCAALISQHKSDLGEAQRWQGVGNKLELIEAGLKAANDVRQGNYAGAVGEGIKYGTDQAICAALGELCPAYKVGNSFGSLIINNIPLAFGSDRTLNDMWTDTLAGWVYGSEPTDAQVQAMIVKQQQKLQQLEATANKPLPNTCSDADSRKSAIDDILARAKARAGAATTIDSDPSLVADTSAAAANAAAAREAVTSSQFQGMANSTRDASAAYQARAQAQTLQQSTTANWQQNSHKPQSPKTCLQWGRDYVDIAGPGGGWQTVCIQYSN